MKKSILISALALAAVATTSCSNEETKAIEPQSNAIEFGTYLGRDAISRGAVADISTVQTNGFGVFGYYTGNSNYANSTAANFMFNQKVSYLSSAWSYSPVKYWPNNNGDKVTFLAYSPTTDDSHIELPSGFDNTSTKDAEIKFTVDGTVGNQVDFLVADKQQNLTKQATTGTVKFNFKHALSRIGFTVEAMVDKVNDDATGDTDDSSVASDAIADGTTITIESLELSTDFSTNGVINLYSQAWTPVTATATTYSWTSSDFATTNVTNTKANLNKTDKYLMILPQTVTNLKFNVVYKVKTLDTALNGGNSEITNTIEGTVTNFTFEAGKAYTFNLHLGMTSVKFDAEVSGWDDINPGTVVNLPINN